MLPLSSPSQPPDALPLDAATDVPPQRRPRGHHLLARSTLLLAGALLVAAYAVLGADAKFDVRRDVRFELHTRQLADAPGAPADTFEELLADEFGDTVRERSAFDPQRPTRIFVHGYWSSRRAYLRYARAFLKNGDCNFIAVNWLNGSKTYNYFRARGRVDRVSNGLGVCVLFVLCELSFVFIYLKLQYQLETSLWLNTNQV